METCLEGLRNDICVPYFDMIIFSKSFEEHVQHVRQVLRQLRAQGVKFKGKEV